MKNKKLNRIKTNLYLDIGLAVAFVVSLKPFATGLAVHEWLGLAIGTALVVHLLLHWRWVVGITRKFFSRLPLKTRAYYALDAGLLLSFATIIASGVVMSRVALPVLGSPNISSEVTAIIHKLSSILTVVLLVVKLALHWSWIENAVKRHIFVKPQIKLRQAQGASSSLAAVPVSVELNVATKKVNRRRFLLLGSGAMAGLILANRLGGKFGELDSAEAAFDEGSVPMEPAETIEPTTVPQSPAVEAAEVSPIVTESDALTLSGADATATPTPEIVQSDVSTPETATEQATSEPSNEVTTSIRCPKGMTNDPYPGRCRHYVDDSGNGYCDLSQVS